MSKSWMRFSIRYNTIIDKGTLFIIEFNQKKKKTNCVSLKFIFYFKWCANIKTLFFFYFCNNFKYSKTKKKPTTKKYRQKRLVLSFSYFPRKERAQKPTQTRRNVGHGSTNPSGHADEHGLELHEWHGCNTSVQAAAYRHKRVSSHKCGSLAPQRPLCCAQCGPQPQNSR